MQKARDPVVEGMGGRARCRFGAAWPRAALPLERGDDERAEGWGSRRSEAVEARADKGDSGLGAGPGEGRAPGGRALSRK